MFDPLRLSANGLLNEGTIAVCNALRESKVSKIQELDLSMNGIGPMGAESVAAYVAVNGGSLTSVRAAPITKVFPLDQVPAMFANPHALCVSQLNLAGNGIRAECV